MKQFISVGQFHRYHRSCLFISNILKVDCLTTTIYFSAIYWNYSFKEHKYRGFEYGIFKIYLRKFQKSAGEKRHFKA